MSKENKKRILIVEDDESNRYLIRYLLEKNNYEVLVAKDGEEGINTAKSEKPDLIIMDVQLPKVDGYTAVKTLKADADTKGIPIIILTAFAGGEDREKAEVAGADNYIARPVDPDVVLQEIKKTL